MIKKILFILLFNWSMYSFAQTYDPTGKGWKYTPALQSDSVQIKTFIRLNGELLKINNPSIGQIIQKDADGIWKNKTATSLAYDSIRFNKTIGQLNLYKSGSISIYGSLDGRYALISSLTDSLTSLRNATPSGVMLKSVYDQALIGGQIVNTSSTQTISNKTLLIPTINDFSSATHNHSSTATGGQINSDNVLQGSTNLFSPLTYQGGNYYLSSGNLGIGGAPASFKLDVIGSTRTQQLALTGTLVFGGQTISGLSTGTGTNVNLATKNYVDDQVAASGGYNNEMAQDAVGGILDNGTIDDVVFSYDDAGNKISASVKNDSHNHTGSTVSGLSVSNFTSANISNWTNNSGYVSSSYGLTGALSGTIASPGIANNAVTLAKIQTIPTSTFLGRMTAGTGNVETLSVANVQGLLGLGSAAYTSSTDYAISSHNHDATYQPLDADLTSIGGLSGTTGLLRKTASNTWSLDNTAYITPSGLTTTLGSYATTSSLSSYQPILNGTGFVKASGTTISYDNNSYALSSHTHSGVYELPLTFSTGLSRIGNIITNTISQYTDAMARASISVTSGALGYNSSTGVISIPSGSGITSLNGLSGSTQLFAYGYSGTSPNWSSSSTTHTLNIPLASTTGVTAGLISKTNYDAFNGKQDAITISNDNSYAGGYYPVMVSGTTTGTAEKISTSKFYFVPSTGVLTVGQLNMWSSVAKIGIGGTPNYGTAGQVLMSGGPSGSVYWGEAGGSSQVYPGVGVAVSNGGGWGTSIDPSTLARLTDLTPYATTSSVSSALSGYVTTGNLSTTLNGYVTTTTLGSTLGSYITSTGLTNTLSGYQSTSPRTTVGNNLYTLPNPSAVTLLRINADNSVSTRTMAQSRDDLGINFNVQALSGTTPSWVGTSGLNATITLSGNTSITLSGLIAGQTGNLTVTNASTTYTLSFSGYTNKISPSVYSSANTVVTSGGSKIDVYSWYYDGTYLIWNGTLNYN
jgi:hypothetical protein